MRLVDNLELVNAIAEQEFERWASWQSYLHERGVPLNDGGVVLTGEDVQRWRERVIAGYAGETEHAKDAYRAMARQGLELVDRMLEQEQPQTKE